MRLFRPLVLFALLGLFTASVQSQPAPGTGGINLFVWDLGSPVGTTGGVDTAVVITPTTGWSCSNVTIRCIDDATNKTSSIGPVTSTGPPMSPCFRTAPSMSATDTATRG